MKPPTIALWPAMSPNPTYFYWARSGQARKDCYPPMIPPLFELNPLRWTILAVSALISSSADHSPKPFVRTSESFEHVAKLEVGAPELSPFPGERGEFQIPVKVWETDASNAQPLEGTYLINGDLASKLQSSFGADAPLAERRAADRLGSFKLKDLGEAKESVASAAKSLAVSCPYKVEHGVSLTTDVERKVAVLAETQVKLGGNRLTITSGTRTPTTQAEAMLTKIKLGDPIMKLYRDKKAASDVLHSYRVARHQNASEEQTVNAMAYAIELQMDAGVYISNHLKAGAVDVRSKDMTSADKSDFMAAIQDTPGLRLGSEESKPPHFHVDVD